MKLSVIIPMYNTSKWCEPLIKTLCEQAKAYKETEIILIDDGSTEDTSWTDNYKIIFEKTQNHGVSHARNVGLDKATGDYIVFVDSDDMVTEDFLETIYKEVDGHEFLVYRHNIPGKPMIFFPGLYPTYALWSYVIKASKLDGVRFDESKKFGEDIDVLRKIMKPNSDIKRIMKRIYQYNYKLNPGSINNRIAERRI